MNTPTGARNDARDRLARTKQHFRRLPDKIQPVSPQIHATTNKADQSDVLLNRVTTQVGKRLSAVARSSRQSTTLPALIVGFALAFFAVLSTAQQNLPSMGEPADTALSPNEERELGARFMRQIRAQLPLIKDVLLNEYIQDLGTRLALAAGKQDAQNFTFFVIDDPQINAFAIPGGYVGVNSGLIAVMQQEEQLASVVAHEVAHVTQRHHARAFATSNRANLSTAAAVLAAIIIGQASPQAGQAALAAGLAASQQSAINFTRGNEIEADRIGIEILANAHYDARAMAESFAILRRKNSLNTSAGQLEYLRTHPLDNNRIAEATDRAGNQPKRSRSDGRDYSLFRARLDVLTNSETGHLLNNYQARHVKKPGAATAYALAMVHLQANRPILAQRYLRELDGFAKGHPMVELLRADIAVMAKQPTDDSALAALSALYPDRYSIVEKRLEMLASERHLAKAAHVAKRYLRHTDNPNPLAWRQLASIQERLDKQAASHESLARYFEAIDEHGRASGQLELALKDVPKGSQDQLRLDASLKEIRSRSR